MNRTDSSRSGLSGMILSTDRGMSWDYCSPYLSTWEGFNTDSKAPLQNHCIRISGAEAENCPQTCSKGDSEAGDSPSSDGEVRWYTMPLLGFKILLCLWKFGRSISSSTFSAKPPYLKPQPVEVKGSLKARKSLNELKGRNIWTVADTKYLLNKCNLFHLLISLKSRDGEQFT